MNVNTVFLGLQELMYALTGLVACVAGVRALKNKTKGITTFIFWMIVGCLFIFGAAVPFEVTGGLICILAVITLSKNISVGEFTEATFDLKRKMADKHGNKIFIPALLIGILSFVFLLFKFGGKSMPSAVALGLASVVALLFCWFMFKPVPKDVMEDTSKMVMQIGPSALLPQLLTGLGAIFTAVGIGDLISGGLAHVIPESNMLVAVIVYCVGMVLFTMIMGNAFAAFAVITTGIAAPFLLAHGANPAVVGALGMTCGFCGTLMTPMAANFNVVAASVMEMKDDNGVIKCQVWLAIPLFIIHILLMYFLAF